MATCENHADKFCQQSAEHLRQWREELSKLLFHRHTSTSLSYSQEANKETGSSEQIGYPMQPGMQQPMLRKPYSAGEGNPMGWPMEAGVQGAGRNGLSVVTTVWGGMTPGTQTAGPRQAPAPVFDVPMYHRTASGQVRPGTPTAAYHTQQPSFYRQNSHPSGPGPGMPAQYRPAYNQPPNGNPDYQPPPGALSAAAIVAAAATATATATATASMMVQHDQSQPSYHRPTGVPAQHPTQMGAQYPVQYASSQTVMQPGVRAQSPANPMMVNREMPAAGGVMPSAYPHGYKRPSPYSAASAAHHQQQVMMQRKAQYGANMPVNPQQYGPMTPQTQAYNQPVHNQYPSHMRQANSMMVQPNQQVTYNTGAPPPYTGTAPGQYPHLVSRNNGMPSQHMAAYQQCQNGYQVTQNMPERKPPAPLNSNDLQLTFPIRDGMILPPFKLEHNLAVSHHTFHLRDQVYQTLLDRPDMEVQLKSYHVEDGLENPNWAASVSVSVNNRPLMIERGDQKSDHKPLYLKSVCMPGKNLITISVCNCCCSHLFVLQLVHKPTVQAIINSLVRKRLRVAENCISKIKANFANINSFGVASVEADGVEQTSVKISLKCPITFRRIQLPARGIACCHIQCFDLESFLRLNAAKSIWKCPVCNKSAQLDHIEVDQYMWAISDQLFKTDVEEINIDANASWKPILSKVKEEDSKDHCAINQWKVYSPSSTNLPSVGSYEGHHNQMSPYPTPPNSHNSQGSSSIAHYNSGVYDVGFNSPPDFTNPMSNRSDMSDDKQRLAMLQRQQSGIASPSQGPASSAQPAATAVYNVPPGDPASNGPKMSQGPPSNMAVGGPPSNTQMSQGPPSNAPASQGPQSKGSPASYGGPASNAPATNNSPHATNANITSELPADISDLVNSATNDSLSLESFDTDLLAYLGPQDSESGVDNLFGGSNTPDADEILALLTDS